MNSQERIDHLIDYDTWRPLDENLSPCDPLEFKDQKMYIERLKEAQERTGLQDAVQIGTGLLDGIPIALAVMDFNFMGGSMGSVVGEKITRLVEYATEQGLTLIIVCASGGARMQEGILSLMQMAKISAVLQIYQSCANLLYISILTSPTTGGVTASFAMLGDLIFAEPKALIGFAGRRVIEQTLQEQLPDDFQTAEYLLHHGLLDLIVPRSFLKQALSETITFYKDAPFKNFGFIPYNIEPKINFLI
jgi:acetyl-CoA carboxylase carboxyl transferase subunit beta